MGLPGCLMEVSAAKVTFTLYPMFWVFNISKCDTFVLTELTKELEDCWRTQEAKILPSLELRRKRMEESAKLIEEVELAFKEWFVLNFLFSLSFIFEKC